MVLRSEFATVRVFRDVTANGDRLCIVDLRSGKANYFDPLQLEALAWCDHSGFENWLKPERRQGEYVE